MLKDCWLSTRSRDEIKGKGGQNGVFEEKGITLTVYVGGG